MTTGPHPVLAALQAALGPAAILTQADRIAPYLHEWRRLYHSKAMAVILPRKTGEVATCLQLAAEFGLAVVPQGGNTGLAGGAVSQASNLILAFTRMQAIREVAPDGSWLIAEAGVTLARLEDCARARGRHYPVSLASGGSCTLGGTLGTNAGGAAVLRHGMTRAQVLGVEWVTAAGEIIDDLAGTAPCLHQLLLGAEGTLGIITAARPRLLPAHQDRATAWIGLQDPAAAIALLGALYRAGGEALTTFELMNQQSLAMVLRHVSGSTLPLATSCPWHVLAEFTAAAPGQLADCMEEALGGAMERGLVLDAVMAQSGGQADRLWHLRESISDAQGFEGASIKHDIAVPVACVPQFLEGATAAVASLIPGVRVVAFGHAGDGNIHFNLSQPVGDDPARFLSLWQDANRVVHDIADHLGGSFSAEHGIGCLKLDELVRYKPAAALEAMRRIKKAFDPANRCNPGKVVIP